MKASVSTVPCMCPVADGHYSDNAISHGNGGATHKAVWYCGISKKKKPNKMYTVLAGRYIIYKHFAFSAWHTSLNVCKLVASQYSRNFSDRGPLVGMIAITKLFTKLAPEVERHNL